MILFGLKCSREPQKISEADYENLRQHQLGQPEIFELIAMSGLAVYANILADATAMEADAMFTAFGTRKNDPSNTRPQKARQAASRTIWPDHPYIEESQLQPRNLDDKPKPSRL